MPIDRSAGASALTSRPSTTMRPPATGRNPATARSSAVLPERGGPSTVKNSP
jgi:hypothetical protein